MPDRRFENLREALLRAGVAPRHVRRAVLEIEVHFHQLVDDGLARGENENDAHLKAQGLLGTDQTLIQRYADMPELRSWASRWTAIWFTVALAQFYPLVVATMARLICSVSEQSLAPAPGNSTSRACRARFPARRRAR